MSHRTKIIVSSIKHIVLLLIMLLLLASIFDDEPPPPPDNEEAMAEVVRKAQVGDEWSFTVLYRWYYTQIYRHLFRMVGNHEDASDLVVETFQKAWKGLLGVHDRRKFPGWLYSIATNVALDHLRRKKTSQPFWECTNEDRIDEYTVSFEGRVEVQELVGQALAQVAPKPRACLLLQLEGFSQDEIAAFLGLRKKSVGTYVSMAREQFRQAYYQLANS